MPSIVLNCPNCRQPYQMSPEQITKYAGRTIACKKCKQPFSFDAAMDAAAQAAGQAEPEEEASDAATAAAGGAEAGAEQGAYAVGESYAAKPPAPAAALPPPRRAVAGPQAAPSNPPPAMPTPPQAYAPPAPPLGHAPQAYAPPGSAPIGYSSAAGQYGIGGLFGFQRMALPAMLPLFFWLGVGYCLFNGLRLLLGFVLIPSFSPYRGASLLPVRLNFNGLFNRLFSVGGLYTILDALFWIILGPLFFRGFCDLILAASRLLAAERK